MNPAGRVARVGEPARFGDLVGVAIEPGQLMARVVGHIHGEKGPWSVLLRKFEPGDERWPSGAYYRSAFLVPWVPS